MASYVERNLVPGEEIVYQGRVSLWHLAPRIVAGVILLPLFGIGLLILIGVWIRYSSTELAITNKRVVAKFGFIRRSTVEIGVRKIETIQIPVHVIRSGKQLDPANFMGSSPTAQDLASNFAHATDLVTDHSHFIPMEAPALTAQWIAAL